jgi:preprotein translocase subunit YajC
VSVVDGLVGLAPFIAIAAVFWFLLIRPQRKRQMELMAMQRAVTSGDEVMLGAGIVGRIVGEADEFLELEVAPGVVMKVARAAVVRVLQPEAADSSLEPAEADQLDSTDPSRDH